MLRVDHDLALGISKGGQPIRHASEVLALGIGHLSFWRNVDFDWLNSSVYHSILWNAPEIHTLRLFLLRLVYKTWTFSVSHLLWLHRLYLRYSPKLGMMVLPWVCLPPRFLPVFSFPLPSSFTPPFFLSLLLPLFPCLCLSFFSQCFGMNLKALHKLGKHSTTWAIPLVSLEIFFLNPFGFTDSGLSY